MLSIDFPWLTTIILFPLLAALVIPVLPDQQGKTIRLYSLGVGAIELVLTLVAFWQNYDLQNPELQLVESYPWIPQLGLNWTLAVDGISMPLIVLTALVTT
ncbi:MAG TPA: NAD(P)H-quinone oxidoreductase subunit 4, partial [Vampirovibrionales bacterium]